MTKGRACKKYRFQDDRAVKRIWPGVYGQIPVPADGGLDRRNVTSSEYLRRMTLHIEVFSSDLRLEGVTISDKPSMIIGQPSGQPSIVISQRWYQKDGVATIEAILTPISLRKDSARSLILFRLVSPRRWRRHRRCKIRQLRRLERRPPSHRPPNGPIQPRANESRRSQLRPFRSHHFHPP